MTALEPPAFQDRPAIGGTRAAPEAVYAHPASLFRLIGTFRHKDTSLATNYRRAQIWRQGDDLLFRSNMMRP